MKSIVHACAEQLRANLVAEYGWTRLECVVDVDRTRRQVLVTGSALVPAIARRFASEVRALIPTSWSVLLSLTVAASLEHGFPEAPLTRVWREHPGRTSRATLATELVPHDRPVGVLARVRDALLIRAADGTIGWMEGRLRQSSRGALRRARGWNEVARSYLGTPYLLGGTTRAGIDCSGLAQRLFHDVEGLVLPRHSRDQRRVAGGNRRLAFLPGHVAIVLEDKDPPAILHASSMRGCVVEELLEIDR